ncbi:uncharacterized protein FOMMEDRAFT_16847 [Fomitiporia mediterranea MF3/22]|uniref:uncharacterized protein n=1 Tax=Fomitiporia mediterranea (strain MF3/22) TaxID=694068 RepID=UPI000440957E|nr:uncharacterized protein FOMMEDRAFT_16847 [Fomitiporia mediterranea MF3/22]EJD08502.1 hypothetical protein FOMMEDRAFT_16847 [Fomitiporia mediterranea MF3/22]
MAPSRAAYSISNTNSSDNDDDDAPEAITLDQSKEHAKQLNEARQAAESDAKRKRKEKNRRTDENLKKRALETRGESTSAPKKKLKTSVKGKHAEESSVSDDRQNLEDRMERAMREAQAEEDEDGGDAWGGFGEQSEPKTGSGSDIEYGQASDDSRSNSDGEQGNLNFADDYDDTEEEEEFDEELLNMPPQKQSRMEYLPDHLFTDALSKTQASNEQKSPPLKTTLKSKPERKRKPNRKGRTKDIILGSKVVRKVAPKVSHITSTASRTLPPGKVRRFYEDRLDLQAKSRSRTHNAWDRKAANIGNMRSSTLPAANFVRNG